LNLDGSHFSALSEQPPAQGASNDPAELATTPTAQIDTLSYQALAAHFHHTDSDPVSSSLEIKDREGLHSVAEQSSLMVFNNQLDAVAATRPAWTDMHCSSSSLTPALETPSSSALTALSAAWNDLHVGPQTLHPVVLDATTLLDAIEITISQFAA